MSDGWQRVKSIFEHAIALDGDERDAYLRVACGNDAKLLAEARAMLDADASGDALFDRGVRAALGEDAVLSATQGATPVTDVAAESILGPYHLIEKIGEGGMGEVWLAEQREPVRRRVAVKIIRRGMDSAQVVARFQAERQALALMDHPAIARVFDAGTSPRGRPYFVMEYIHGLPITEHCDRERMTTRERIALFLRVCEGVQHAHQKGIIHRDLKPSNVLITSQNGKALPKIIDFGVAKATEQRLTEETMDTELGVLIGTPEYMSPEQACPDTRDIDTRTDVYALGVLLYELLVGELPFDARRLRQAGFDEIRRQIREVDPPTPSRRVSTLSVERTGASAKARGTEPAALKRQLRGDLDWITMRALEKERARRYNSPNELAADLARHIANEPVLASPPSRAYRARKFVRRHRVGVSFVVALAVLLIGFVVALGVQAGRIARQRDRANQNAAELELVTAFQAQQLSGIKPEVIGSRLRQSLVDERRAALEHAEADPDGIEQTMAALDEALLHIDFNNLAVQTFHENVFDPALTTIDAQFSDQPLMRARLLQSVADSMWEAGLSQLAEAPQTEALLLRRTLLGDLHPDTLVSIEHLARDSIESKGGGVALYREVVEGRTRVLGPDHPDTLRVMADLGNRLAHMSRYDEGVALLREALERSEQELGVDDPVTIYVRSRLGLRLGHQGLSREAVPIMREAYETALRVLGPQHRITLESADELGGLLWRVDRLDEAEPFIRQTLERYRTIYGDHHRLTIDAISLLAVLLEGQGRLEECEQLTQATLETARRFFEPDSGQVLVSQHNLGFVQYKLGRFEEAEANLREVLELRRQKIGDDHDKTIVTAGNLAMVLVARGRPAEAEPLAREAVERGAVSRGPDHWVVGNCRGQLGLALAALGRFAESERELVEAHRVLVNTLGDHHERTRRVVGYLGELYDAWHEAEPEAGHDTSAERWRRRLPRP